MRVFLPILPLAAVLTAFLTGCADDAGQPMRVAGGDARIGKQLIEQYQCGSCHAIPDVAAAAGTTGPSLTGFGRRSYIAGSIPNVPENLTAWLIDPPALKPGTMMPNVGISQADARHMAAYLYTVR